MDWHRAACRDEGPELFFPVGRPGMAANVEQIAEAKAVCRRCPIAAACLTWALETRTDTGVFGGMDETERRALRLRHLAEHPPTPTQPDTNGRPGPRAVIDLAEVEHLRAGGMSTALIADHFGVTEDALERHRWARTTQKAS